MIEARLTPHGAVDRDHLKHVVESCLASIGANGEFGGVTLSVPRLWRAPRGFPRHELLSIGIRGNKNIRCMAWPVLRMLHEQQLIELKVVNPAGG